MTLARRVAAQLYMMLDISKPTTTSMPQMMAPSISVPVPTLVMSTVGLPPNTCWKWRRNHLQKKRWLIKNFDIMEPCPTP